MIPDDLEQAPQWLDQLANEGLAKLAKIEQLHFHALRMVQLLNLIVETQQIRDDRARGDISLATQALKLAELADPRFLNHIHALFTKLAAREFTLLPRETT